MHACKFPALDPHVRSNSSKNLSLKFACTHFGFVVVVVDVIVVIVVVAAAAVLTHV
jgi:hypothetical protein